MTPKKHYALSGKQILRPRSRTLYIRKNQLRSSPAIDAVKEMMSELTDKVELLSTINEDNLMPIERLAEGMTVTRQLLADVLTDYNAGTNARIQELAALGLDQRPLKPRYISFTGFDFNLLNAEVIISVSVTQETEKHVIISSYSFKLLLAKVSSSVFMAYHNKHLIEGSDNLTISQEIAEKLKF